jgi:predicted Zn-dependent protease
MRLYWFVIALVGAVGCESLRKPAAQGDPSPAIPREAGYSGLAPLHGEGGERSKPGEETASQLQPVVATQPPAPEAPDPLTLAAECLERGDRASAATHLEAYVRLHPEQLMFRAQLAELLLRVGRDSAAKAQYEQFIADAQAATGAPRKQLVNAHTRLMEIAQRDDDQFAEVFHRGVGLLLLVKEQEKMAERDEEFGEEMLCKAIRALSEAKELKPADPRVRVYLAEAYDRSGNRRAADAERAAAKSAFATGQLTPTERKQLMLLPN